MFMILLRFAANKDQTEQFFEAHKAWIKKGFEDGVFLLAGGIQPGVGGAIAAHNTTRKELGERIDKDPFVANNVVSAEILEITPSMTDQRLDFLKSG